MTDRKILVVDDDVDGAEVLASILEWLGYSTSVCYGGMEALEKVRSWQPQVVLLDLYMPGMNGYEVAERLRSSKETEDVVLIAITGRGKQRDKDPNEEGFDLLLRKPIDVEFVNRLLKEAFADL